MYIFILEYLLLKERRHRPTQLFYSLKQSLFSLFLMDNFNFFFSASVSVHYLSWLQTVWKMLVKLSTLLLILLSIEQDTSGYLKYGSFVYSTFKSLYLSMNIKRHQILAVLDKEQMFWPSYLWNSQHTKNHTRKKKLTRLKLRTLTNSYILHM